MCAKWKTSSSTCLAHEEGGAVKSTVLADEKGTGLVEILISVAIIAIVLTIFLSALSTTSSGVAVVSERVTAENLARAQLECIQDHLYINGASPISYTTVCTVTTTTLPAYHTDLDISYWYSPTETFTSFPTDDGGMQWITVTVSHQGEPVFTIGNYKVDR
jgi:type II secretory pathway pseudopilin PulG